MKNTNLLIGAGVVIVGYLLYKKSQKDELNKRLVDMQNKPKSPSDYLEKDSLGMPELKINSFTMEDFKNPFKATTPKVILDATNNVITPNNTQGATRIINDIAIDKLPNIVNQEDIELFFWNNPNIKSREGSGNIMYDAQYKPIYQRLRKLYIQKDALGTIISGDANEGHFYKENGKFYVRTPYSYGSETCEISENDYLEYFVNIKDGSYRKLNYPSIKKMNCNSAIGRMF